MGPGGYQGCQGLFIAGQADLETMAVPSPGTQAVPRGSMLPGGEYRKNSHSPFLFLPALLPGGHLTLPLLSDLVTGSSADL